MGCRVEEVNNFIPAQFDSARIEIVFGKTTWRLKQRRICFEATMEVPSKWSIQSSFWDQWVFPTAVITRSQACELKLGISGSPLHWLRVSFFPQDMMQSQYSLQSPSLSDELSLPGCSPPLSSAGPRSVSHMSTNGNSFVDQAVHNLHLMVNERNYRNVASFPNYAPWRKYDDYQHSYQDGGHSGGHYRSIVT